MAGAACRIWLLMAGVLLAASTVLAGCGSGGSEAVGGRLQPTGRSSMDAPTIEQQRHLSVFRTAAEGVPPLVSAVIDTPPHGVRWTQAQELPGSLTMRVWAVPGGRYICLVSLRSVGAVGVTCRTTQDVLRAGLATTLLDDDPAMGVERMIIGILPDGAAGIRASVIGGATVVAANRGGWFFHSDHVPAPPDAFHLIPGSNIGSPEPGARSKLTARSKAEGRN